LARVVATVIAMPCQEAGEALAAANALAGGGRYLEAVDALRLANRHERSNETDRKLVQLRHDAFLEVDRPRPPTAWPPTLRDPFPQTTDLVEMHADALTPAVVGGAILHHGCVLVRGLLPRDVAARLAAQTDLAFEAQERWRRNVESGGDDRATADPWFEPFTPDPRYAIDPLHLPLSRMNRDSCRVLLVDSPPAMFEVLEALERVGMHRLLTAYLGERPVMTVSRSVLRRLPQQPRALGWHQDASIFGRPAPSLNCWIAFNDCGDDAPGIEVVPRRVDHVLDVPANRALSRAGVAMEPPSAPLRGVAPVFAPGDALIFDDLLVHRTTMHARMKRTRYSMENWCFTAEGLPPHNAPIVF
jgi:hypothetical protein